MADPAIVQSVDRAVQILELLADSAELGVTEIARELDVHRSTAFRLLATLEARGLVAQEERRGTYQLGLGMMRLARDLPGRCDLSRAAQAVCDAAAAELDETCNVAILERGRAVSVSQANGTQNVQVARQYVGQALPLHATSTGKILLAYGPGERIEEALSGGLEASTERTITDADELRAHLALVRERGWAAADAEWEPDTNAVAVPVRGATGEVVAALSVTAPAFRMPEARFADLAAALAPHADALGRAA